MFNKLMCERAHSNWLLQRAVCDFMYNISRLESTGVDMLSIVRAMMEHGTQSTTQNKETLQELAFTIGSVLQDEDMEVEDHDK